MLNRKSGNEKALIMKFGIKFFLLFASLCLCLAVGCDNDSTSDSSADDDASPLDDDDNDDDSPNGDDDDDDDDDTLPSRSFSLAAAPMRYLVGPWSVETVFDTAYFAGEIDLLSMHNDFFGLPWEEFAAGGALPPAWLAAMEDIKAQVETMGVGVFLSVTALDGDRDTLMGKARDDGGELVIDENWAERCFDFDASPDAAKWRTAYKNYVAWMVDFFEPQFLNNMIEMDLYAAACPAQYAALIDLANEVYEQEKTARPDLIIFPSFVMSEYWGFDDGLPCAPLPGQPPTDHSCFAAAVARDADIKRDRYGVSSYPSYYIQTWGSLPADYYSALTEYTGERVVFAEIGVGSRDVIMQYPTPEDACIPVLYESENTHATFLQGLLEEANTLDSDLVTWWSFRDFLPAEMPSTCPCDAPDTWCVLYDAIQEVGLLPLWLMWGSMGILDYDGNAKQAVQTWRSWRERPIE